VDPVSQDYLATLADMAECTFEEFVKSLVCHSFGSERQYSRYRGVHSAPNGNGGWEARLLEENSSTETK
jgi:hypothetical protein